MANLRPVPVLDPGMSLLFNVIVFVAEEEEEEPLLLVVATQLVGVGDFWINWLFSIVAYIRKSRKALIFISAVLTI